MEIAGVYIIIGLCLCSLLVLFYSLTLIRALNGTRYRIILTTIILLLLSNVAYIILLVGNLEII